MSIWPRVHAGRQHFYEMMHSFGDQQQLNCAILEFKNNALGNLSWFNNSNREMTYNFDTHWFEPIGPDFQALSSDHRPIARRDLLINSIHKFAVKIFPGQLEKQNDVKEYLHHKLCGDQDLHSYYLNGRPNDSESIIKFIDKLEARALISPGDKAVKQLRKMDARPVAQQPRPVARREVPPSTPPSATRCARLPETDCRTDQASTEKRSIFARIRDRLLGLLSPLLNLIRALFRPLTNTIRSTIG